MRSLRRLLITSSFLVAATVPRFAEAQRAAPPRPTGSAPETQFSMRREQAGGPNGAAGRKRAISGDCAGALSAFDAAIRGSIDPTLRRDRGLCHEKLGSPYPAIDDYRAYLVARPEAPDAERIRARLLALEDDVASGSSSSSAGPPVAGARAVGEAPSAGTSAQASGSLGESEAPSGGKATPSPRMETGSRTERATAPTKVEAALPEPSPQAGPNRRRRADEEEPELKHFAVTINPLSLIISRFGLNAEYVVAQHHALGLNPFYQSLNFGSGSLASTLRYVGGELGYRYYTGRRGVNGFFVGPFVSILGLETSAKTTLGTSETSSVIFSGGIDLGGQHVFENGFTIGAGFGLQYFSSDSKSSSTIVNGSSTVQSNSSSSFELSGVLPRFLFTLGWSF